MQVGYALHKNGLGTEMYSTQKCTRHRNVLDFVQHIDKPTHNSGHLLDYIIARLLLSHIHAIVPIL